MTGGVVAVLGETGRNFAAGMSGGVAYVYDPDGAFESKLNTGMVTFSESLTQKDERMLTRMVENHAEYTDSDRAADLLDDWAAELDNFVRVFPDAYRNSIENKGADDVREELPETPSAAADASAGTGAVSSDD
jgi:glutamate synthase (NADPH/NADH) large chain